MTNLFEKIQLEPDEEIITIVRKHWFALFAPAFGLFITATLPFILLAALTATGSFGAQAGAVFFTYQSYLLFAAATWLLMHIMSVAYLWTDWYLDLWILTDRRIISIDQKGLFNRQIGSFRLERLQDINISINGIVATFLNYGTVEAETASGSDGEFRASFLPDPRGLKSQILSASDSRV